MKKNSYQRLRGFRRLREWDTITTTAERANDVKHKSSVSTARNCSRPTLSISSMMLSQSNARKKKFFGSFFQKRNCFPPYCDSNNFLSSSTSSANCESVSISSLTRETACITVV